jgi:hypothetical protein
MDASNIQKLMVSIKDLGPTVIVGDVMPLFVFETPHLKN